MTVSVKISDLDNNIIAISMFANKKYISINASRSGNGSLLSIHTNFYIEKLMFQIGLWFPFYSWSGNTLVSSVVYIEPQVWVVVLLLFVITANRCSSRISQGQQRLQKMELRHPVVNIQVPGDRLPSSAASQLKERH